MAWTTPRLWTAGELVTASIMNTHVRDNLAYLHGDAGTIALGAGVGVTGHVTASTYLSAGTALSTSAGDITANRGGTGVVFLGLGTRYVYFNGTGYEMPGAELAVNGATVSTTSNTLTLSNKTFVNPIISGGTSHSFNGMNVTDYTMCFGTGTLTLPSPASYPGRLKFVKAYLGNISVQASSGGLFGPGSNSSANFTLASGDSLTLWSDGSNWWVV